MGAQKRENWPSLEAQQILIKEEDGYAELSQIFRDYAEESKICMQDVKQKDSITYSKNHKEFYIY